LKRIFVGEMIFMTYELPKREKEIIEDAFKDVRGDRLSNRQKRILHKYEVSYEALEDNCACLKYGSRKITFSLTSSDIDSGRLVARSLINLIEEECYEK